MTKWLNIAVVSLILVTANRSFAAEPELTETNKSLFGVSLTTMAASKYLFVGNGSVIYDKPVVTTEIEVTLPANFYAGVWLSSGFDARWNNNLGDEIDYNAGWAGSLGPIDIDIGMSYYDSARVFTFGADDCFNGHLSVSHTFEIKTFEITPFIGWNNYVTTRTTEYNGGNVFDLGLGVSKGLFSDKLTLSGDVRMMYDTGTFGADNGILFGGSFDASWALTDHLSLIAPRLEWAIPGTTNDDRERAVAVSVGLNYTF
jgi:hypothetical protein